MVYTTGTMDSTPLMITDAMRCVAECWVSTIVWGIQPLSGTLVALVAMMLNPDLRRLRIEDQAD
jgi:hypothetical protein